MRIRLISAVLLACLMAGCSTFSADRYATSADTVVVLRELDSAVAVDPFTAEDSGQYRLLCRDVGPVAAPDETPFEEYVRSALVSELKMAGRYDPEATIRLRGHLERMDFNSTAGTWSLALTLESPDAEPLRVEERYSFASSIDSEVACMQTAQAMMPAVQNLIARLVQHEHFGQLIQP